MTDALKTTAIVMGIIAWLLWATWGTFAALVKAVVYEGGPKWLAITVANLTASVFVAVLIIQSIQ